MSSVLFLFNNSDVKKVLIVLTDGQCGDSVTQPAQKLKKDDVIIYSLRVGPGISRTELIGMASLPANKHVFYLNDFEASFAVQISSSTTFHGETNTNFLFS